MDGSKRSPEEAQRVASATERRTPRLETILAQLGRGTAGENAPVSAPIYQTATFAHADFERGRGYDYSRTRNPTRDVLEEAIARLDGGVRGFAFASGMAALDTVACLLCAGDHLVVGEHVYGGTQRLVEQVVRRRGVSVTFAPTDDLDRVAAAMRPETRAILCETPANPTLCVSDIAALAALAHRAGALCIVDNTFLTPCRQRPLQLGADIALYSATKYIAGHHDVVAGLVSVADPGVGERLAACQNTLGTALGPMDSWLTLRGMKTLLLRMDRHEANALAVARHLQAHPAVSAVHYPGLPEDPGYALNRRQATGAGGTLAFRLVRADRVRAVVAALELVIYAESLGGPETLITHPASQTHRDVDPELRARLGLTDELVRLSVGLEAVDDIVADLDRALALAL
jgi:cystathionine gamma-synthase